MQGGIIGRRIYYLWGTPCTEEAVILWVCAYFIGYKDSQSTRQLQAADATILTPQHYIHMLETLQPYVLTDILNLYAGRSGLHI